MTARVLVGDCLLVMPALDADSIDAIVTEPPRESCHACGAPLTDADESIDKAGER